MVHSAAQEEEPGIESGPQAEQRQAEAPLGGRRIRLKQPLRDAVVWYTTLRNTFGGRFLIFLTVTFFGLRGLSFTWMHAAMLPMFKAMHADINTFQLASILAQMPWAMKGFIGVLSDVFPIFGYHKRNYLIISSGLGLTGIIGLLLSRQLGFSIWAVAFFFSLSHLMQATFDLLCQGKYTELMNKNGGAAEAVSFNWSSANFGTFLAATVVFALVDSLGFEALLWLCVPCAVIALERAMRGAMPEERLRPGQDGVQWAKLQSEPGMFALAASVAGGAILVTASAMAFDSELQLVSVFSLSVGLIAFSYMALPRTLANCNLYMFLGSLAYVDLSGPLGYYYTADSSCVPNGPGFSNGYYLAVTSIIGAIGGVIGSVCFQGIQSWSFRQAFWLTTVVQTLASLIDWIIVKRLNLAIGISDRAFFLFGDAACQQLAIMLATMPYVLLTALLCPRGAEATVYAILAGFQNFGMSVAGVLGVLFTRRLHIRAVGHGEGGDCDFTNLGTAILIAHCLLPMLCLPATWILIPNVRMDDTKAFELITGAPSATTSNSEVELRLSLH